MVSEPVTYHPLTGPHCIPNKLVIYLFSFGLSHYCIVIEFKSYIVMDIKGNMKGYVNGYSNADSNGHPHRRIS